MQILIIGAGIIGASLAYELTTAGARVTVLEAALPAGAASGRSFGWINASFYASAEHYALRMEGIAAHHRWAAKLPRTARRPKFPGALWFEDTGDGFEVMASALEIMGYPLERLGRKEFAELEPNVTPPDRALHLPAEGWIDAATLTHDLLAAACEQGARLWQGVAVRGLLVEEGRVAGLRTDQGAVRADHVVIAAGVGSPALLADLDLTLPMARRPGLTLHTQPLPPLLGHVLASPHLEFRQLSNGRILAPTATGHQGDDTETIIELPGDIADAALQRLQEMIPNHDLRWEKITAAERPVPKDGLPCIGHVSAGLSLAVLHSGVTLSAVVAELLSAEIMGKGESELLRDFRPARLLTPVSD